MFTTNSGELSVPVSADGRTPNVRSLTVEDVIANTESIDLLSINDFHGSIDESSKNPGASKLGQYLLDARSANENTLLMSAGDNYQGSAISNLTKGMIVNDIFDYIELDYSAVGNHEFDFGREAIVDWNQSTKFLAANIVNKSTRNTSPSWVEPYSIESFTVAGQEVKVGVIGIATPDTYFTTDPKQITDLDFLDAVSTVAEYEPIVRAEGADFVFVLSHSPSFIENDVVSNEAADIAQNTNVDGVFSGHSHQTVEGEVNNKPVLQGYYAGRAVSKMSVVYSNDGEYLGTYGIVDSIYKIKDQLSTNSDIDAIINDYSADLEDILGEVVGSVEGDLPHQRLAGEEQVTPMGYEMARIVATANNTDIAILNGGGIRIGFEEVELTYDDVYTAFPFDNTIVTVDVTGAELEKLILHGIDPESFRPGQYYGINVYYDEASKQITSMRLANGEQVDPTKVYSITTIDFLVNGGDMYARV